MKVRLQQHPVDVRQIQMMSMVNLSFAVNDVADSQTPYLLNVINLCALDQLSDRRC